MHIPPDKIDEIRNSIDIVDLIGSIVPLKKRGKNFVGSCPFHQEKTPSFNVSPERQMYHCFGCGVGGNAFTFVMEYEKVSFPEAVRSLAGKLGIMIPEYPGQDDAKLSEQEELYSVCKEAGLFYHRSMMDTTEGKLAYEYFKMRGFNDETIKAFGLGYSPNGWDVLVRQFSEKGTRTGLLERAGLARRREDGSYNDYFRGRAMFPIFSPTGRVLGFGARKLREDDPLGKYINSPETLIYNKSRILYGLMHAKDEIRSKDFVILVEGYADLITVHQAGFKNVVASSGTALTVEQIQLIGRYTKKITVMYDADSAGSKAAMRGVDLILENDMDVQVAVLPEGDDPDSFINRNGGKKFQELLDASVSFVDFIADSYEKDGLLKTPEGQARTVRAIMKSIAKMKDELKRNFYIRHVADKYKLYEVTLHRELEKQAGELQRSSSHQSRGGSQGAEGEPARATLEREPIPPLEKDLLHTLLEGDHELVSLAERNVDPGDLSHPVARSLYASILNRWKAGKQVNADLMVDELEDAEEKKVISEIVFSPYNLSNGWTERGIDIAQGDPRKIASDIIVKLRERSLERDIEDNQDSMRKAAQSGKSSIPYLEIHKKLREELKNLQSGEGNKK